MANWHSFQGTDALQLLIQQANENAGDAKKSIGLSEAEIVGNSYLFLLAGYETTSTALGFTAWLLAKHPQTQRRLQEELDAALPQGGADWDVLSRLPYLDAVFHEALRVFPPVVSFVGRTCVEATQLGHLDIPKGTVVVVPTYSIHHDAEHWPQPELFDPERFYLNKDWDRMAWLPFGAGPRNCVGLRFAEMEVKKALATLLGQFSLRLGPESDQDLNPIIRGAMLSPPNGLKLYISQRN
jgi:cytochrome P450